MRGFFSTTDNRTWAEYPDMPGSSVEFTIGLDLGQAQDFTAAAILERRELVFRDRDPVTWEPFKKVEHLVRHLHRMPLGTPYTEVVDDVASIVRSPAIFGRCTLVVDATGVGRAVVDALKAARLGCPVVPVTITGGDQSSHSNGMWRVPKRDLIGDLQYMLERRDIGIADGLEEGPELVKELRGMRVKIGYTGHETVSSWREGVHDDLVFAVALAAWWSRSRRKNWGTERLI
jgi:hypothetical protein